MPFTYQQPTKTYLSLTQQVPAYVFKLHLTCQVPASISRLFYDPSSTRKDALQTFSDPSNLLQNLHNCATATTWSDQEEDFWGKMLQRFCDTGLIMPESGIRIVVSTCEQLNIERANECQAHISHAVVQRLGSRRYTATSFNPLQTTTTASAVASLSPLSQ
ncbi:hypothetical protein L218DRAFT_1010773 [Marasmius fiardii PR-910]|nr:hypothetical protein L218DRAFT_1010773 [Marasmius fiardii PR-910]